MIRRALVLLTALSLLLLLALPTAWAGVGFSDTKGTAHAPAVDALAQREILLGCDRNLFCARKSLTRGQAASIVARALDLPPATSDGRYRDTGNTTHRRAIDSVTEAGIARGCEADRFCPQDVVTRAQLATMLHHAFDLPDAKRSGRQHFNDVSGTHASAIASITEAGIANGCDLVHFCGRAELQRGHAAVFFARAMGLVERVSVAPLNERQARYDRQQAQQEAKQLSAAQAPGTRAAEVAIAQVGKPYRYGATGPGSFDCSGLTSFAWRAAGVELPRTSRSQFSGTTRISRSQLRPGDLVFYYSPISHVAMYVGDGRIVEAPNSRSRVRLRADGLSRSGVVGYGRPRT